MKFSTFALGMFAGMAASAAIPASVVDGMNLSDNGLGTFLPLAFCLIPIESLSSSFQPSNQSSHPTNIFFSPTSIGLVNAGDPVCHKNSDCGPGIGYCYKGICVADPPKVERDDPICHKNSDCGPGVGYCYKGICVADPPKLTRDDASIVTCHTNKDCFNGLCIAGICHWGIGESSASNTANQNSASLVQTSEPADPVCHKNSDCGPGVGYCYHGICLADPPKLTSRDDPICHKNSDCGPGVGYCYHGICVADPPMLARDEQTDPVCHKNSDCGPGVGYCYHGICVAGPPVVPRGEEADPVCHKDSDCGPGVGYCYHGICLAEPPK